jgi:hypothetical protein
LKLKSKDGAWYQRDLSDKLLRLPLPRISESDERGGAAKEKERRAWQGVLKLIGLAAYGLLKWFD